jgi:serine/threonine protein kinase
LENILFKEKRIFDRAEIYDICGKLIDIICYLHGQGIVHRDIRIPNIIINDNGLYLVDFGHANYIDNKRYKPDVDFSYLGDTLLYLYYSSIIDVQRDFHSIAKNYTDGVLNK